MSSRVVASLPASIENLRRFDLASGCPLLKSCTQKCMQPCTPRHPEFWIMHNLGIVIALRIPGFTHIQIYIQPAHWPYGLGDTSLFKCLIEWSPKLSFGSLGTMDWRFLGQAPVEIVLVTFVPPLIKRHETLPWQEWPFMWRWQPKSNGDSQMLALKIAMSTVKKKIACRAVVTVQANTRERWWKCKTPNVLSLLRNHIVCDYSYTLA